MKIRQLEYFCAVAEEKSISAAARKLHVAQPPISRQILLLEDELHAQLFVRKNKGVELTQAGQQLFDKSQRLMDSMQEIADSIRNYGAGLVGILKIGMIYSTVTYAMAYIKQFHEDYPQVELYIRLGSPQELVEDLNRGNLHAVFLRSSRRAAGDHERLLQNDDLQLIMTAATDPAPDLPTIPIERLQGCSMCLLRGGDLWGYDDMLLRECQRKGIVPQITCHCYDTPMIMQMVQAGLGIAFLPRSILKSHPQSGIYAKSFEGLQEKSHTVLIWSNTGYTSTCVERFTKQELHCV